MSLILDGTAGLFGNVTGGDISGNIIGLNGNSIPVTATGSTTARSLANRFADVVNVKDFGAVGDGVADDTAAIQAAVNTGKTVYLPSGTYRTTSTINITGTGTGIYGDGPKATKILADISVTPVVRVNIGTHIKISDIWVSRAAGVVDPNSVGIQWDNWNYGYEDSVTSDRHGYCWNYNGPSASVAIGHRVTKLHAYSAVTAYFRVNGIAGLYMSQCEGGRNGGDDFCPTYCMVIRDQANGCVWTDCEFIPRHPSANTTTTTIYFEDYNNVGVFEFKGCNTENVKHIFGSNAANQTITELRLIGGRWTNALGQAINNLNPATSLVNSSFTGAVFGSGTLTFIPVQKIRMTGCWTEALTVFGGSGGINGEFQIVGCTIKGPFTASGEIENLELIGNYFAGSYSNTATGNIAVYDSQYQKIVSETAGQLLIRDNNNFAYGTATPVSLLTIKQRADSDAGGLALIGPDTIANPNNTNQWGIRTGSGVNGQLYFSYNNSAKAYIDYSTGSFVALSDAKLKENINPIQNGLENILKLNPVSYSMIFDNESKPHLGFIAQEIKEVLPSSISEFSDGTLAMDKSEIIAVLVKAVQELSAKVEALESK
jgi:hypothetical protein